MVQEILAEEEDILAERALEETWFGSAILDRPIRDLPNLREPLSLACGSPIARAIELMNRAAVGCVLVVEDGRLSGVFTERDVLTRVMGTGVDCERTPVDAVMTPAPECLTLDDGIAYALNKMSVGGFRHVPLVDADHRPTGVVGMRHVVDYIVDLFPRAILNLPPTPELGITRTREGA